MGDLLNIGIGGLRVSQAALTTTGHNITNVSTPGYSRQNTTQGTTAPQFSGVGYVGTGVTLTDIRRSYNEFLTAQVRNSTSLSGDVEAYKVQIDQMDALLSGTTTSINNAMQSFFSALQTSAEDPANIPARQLVLSQAEGLAGRFNTMYTRMIEQNAYANSQMEVIAKEINHITTSIGSLNTAIVSASTGGQTPNDLLDARDEALRQLSAYVGNSVVVQDGNSVNVFVGSGQPLVMGGAVNRLEVTNSTGDPTRNAVHFVSGGSTQDITSLIKGGEMGGLIRYREEVLDPALNSLGRLALTVSEQVNSQLAQGLDLKGNVGTNLFAEVNSDLQQTLRVSAYSTNRSDIAGKVAITNASLLSVGDYRLEYENNTFTAKRSDGATINVHEDNGVLTFTDMAGRDQGFSLTLSGTPYNGDKFTLMPTRRGAIDIASKLDQPDQLAFAGPLRSEANLQNVGNAVITQPNVQAVIDPNTLPKQTLQSEPLNLANLKALGEIQMSYNASSGTLDFVTPLPAGVTITTVPKASAPAPAAPAPAPTPITGLAVNAGQSNELSYAIEVTTNGVTQSYTINQSFSGRPADKDTFTVSFNQNGVSDNRNALQIVDMQNKQVVGVDPTVSHIATGSSFTDGYGDMIERVATLAAQTKQDSAATSTILKNATDSRDSVAGVNLDEEAANLIKFEQYYNASAQIIQVARGLFDTLLSSVR